MHLLGERTDVSRIMSALDVASSSSYSEAFSNVIGEAMACVVSGVVTDVGESLGMPVSSCLQEIQKPCVKDGRRSWT